ncbi:hypothetical protein [Desulfovibrio litoralis]|uniref:Uncharacterized protein n=1 Tax=Desulfovibrio litoralis DSM 11393 TaxID=1121455 RepID=A0A1M7TI08_9BACT|nr:hypothetical protein [Desulfovibrio litoralis]SHN70350.1 hypothetical protein SAMN02745728_02032 [Desulfovibrio litoralis DSM 11393]
MSSRVIKNLFPKLANNFKPTTWRGKIVIIVLAFNMLQWLIDGVEKHDHEIERLLAKWLVTLTVVLILSFAEFFIVAPLLRLFNYKVTPPQTQEDKPFTDNNINSTNEIETSKNKTNRFQISINGLPTQFPQQPINNQQRNTNKLLWVLVVFMIFGLLYYLIK